MVIPHQMNENEHSGFIKASQLPLLQKEVTACILICWVFKALELLKAQVLEWHWQASDSGYTTC